ncbi:H/ACA ribonucleoprotein complex subunit 4 [Plasmodium inui San Antonio 1]|uniref:H/ACA ribonucleoprotein complex subunit 4 n=1 Tax=Plasmodium inui San Antonio 1 TaxID=1237626 RepID=W7A9X8_9APIC|nr:H/ACA ribonucleoprotein complex subunit 4 [Plasmodium inui San Antonio 1]EUD65949.1 H/ACA ribonucleoprotein complex subunit 4 [Plasmodium inui San Antonio 1]
MNNAKDIINFNEHVVNRYKHCRTNDDSRCVLQHGTYPVDEVKRAPRGYVSRERSTCVIMAHSDRSLNLVKRFANLAKHTDSADRTNYRDNVSRTRPPDLQMVHRITICLCLKIYFSVYMYITNLRKLCFLLFCECSAYVAKKCRLYILNKANGKCKAIYRHAIQTEEEEEKKKDKQVYAGKLERSAGRGHMSDFHRIENNKPTEVGKKNDYHAYFVSSKFYIDKFGRIEKSAFMSARKVDAPNWPDAKRRRIRYLGCVTRVYTSKCRKRGGGNNSCTSRRSNDGDKYAANLTSGSLVVGRGRIQVVTPLLISRKGTYTKRNIFKKNNKKRIFQEQTWFNAFNKGSAIYPNGVYSYLRNGECLKVEVNGKNEDYISESSDEFEEQREVVTYSPFNHFSEGVFAVEDTRGDSSISIQRVVQKMLKIYLMLPIPLRFTEMVSDFYKPVSHWAVLVKQPCDWGETFLITPFNVLKIIVKKLKAHHFYLTFDLCFKTRVASEYDRKRAYIPGVSKNSTFNYPDGLKFRTTMLLKLFLTLPQVAEECHKMKFRPNVLMMGKHTGREVSKDKFKRQRGKVLSVMAERRLANVLRLPQQSISGAAKRANEATKRENEAAKRASDTEKLVDITVSRAKELLPISEPLLERKRRFNFIKNKMKVSLFLLRCYDIFPAKYVHVKMQRVELRGANCSRIDCGDVGNSAMRECPGGSSNKGRTDDNGKGERSRKRGDSNQSRKRDDGGQSSKRGDGGQSNKRGDGGQGGRSSGNGDDNDDEKNNKKSHTDDKGEKNDETKGSGKKDSGTNGNNTNSEKDSGSDAGGGTGSGSGKADSNEGVKGVSNGAAKGSSNGASNGTSNEASNGTSNAASNGASNAASNGASNEASNGTSNEASNGTSNGTSNGMSNADANSKKRRSEKGRSRSKNKGDVAGGRPPNQSAAGKDDSASVNNDSFLLNNERKESVKRKKGNKTGKKNGANEKNDKYSLNLLIAEDAYKIVKNGRVYKPTEPVNSFQTHQNFMLREMMWMSIDYYEEKRWKKNVSKRFSYQVNNHFEDRKKNDKYFISSQISNDIKIFWFFVLNEVRPDLVPVDVDHKVKNKNLLKRDFFKSVRKNFKMEGNNLFTPVEANPFASANDEQLDSHAAEDGEQSDKCDSPPNDSSPSGILSMARSMFSFNFMKKSEASGRRNIDKGNIDAGNIDAGNIHAGESPNYASRKDNPNDEQCEPPPSGKNSQSASPTIDANKQQTLASNSQVDERTIEEYQNYEQRLILFEENVSRELLSKHEHHSRRGVDFCENFRMEEEYTYRSAYHYNDDYVDYYSCSTDYLDLSNHLYIYCLLFMSISLIEVNENIFYNNENLINDDQATYSSDDEQGSTVPFGGKAKLMLRQNEASDEMGYTKHEKKKREKKRSDSNHGSDVADEGEVLEVEGAKSMNEPAKLGDEETKGNNPAKQNTKIKLEIVKKESKNEMEEYDEEVYREYARNHHEYQHVDDGDDFDDVTRLNEYADHMNHLDYYDEMRHINSNMLTMATTPLNGVDVNELLVIPYSASDRIISKGTGSSATLGQNRSEFLNQIKQKNVNLYMNNMELCGGRTYPFELEYINNSNNDIRLPLVNMSEYDEFTFFLYLFYLKNSPYILKKQMMKEKRKRKRDFSDVASAKKRTPKRKLNKAENDKTVETVLENEKCKTNEQPLTNAEVENASSLNEVNRAEENDQHFDFSKKDDYGKVGVKKKGIKDDGGLKNNHLSEEGHHSRVRETKEGSNFTEEQEEQNLKTWADTKEEWTSDEVNFLLILTKTYMNYVNVDSTQARGYNGEEQPPFEGIGDCPPAKNHLEQASIEVAPTEAVTSKVMHLGDAQNGDDTTAEQDGTTPSQVLNGKGNNNNRINSSESRNNSNNSSCGGGDQVHHSRKTQGNSPNEEVLTAHEGNNNARCAEKTMAPLGEVPLSANYIYSINWNIISLALASYNKINHVYEIRRTAEECKDKFFSLFRDKSYADVKSTSLHGENYLNNKKKLKKGSKRLKFLSIFPPRSANSLIGSFNKYMREKIEMHRQRRKAASSGGWGSDGMGSGCRGSDPGRPLTDECQMEEKQNAGGNPHESKGAKNDQPNRDEEESEGKNSNGEESILFDKPRKSELLNGILQQLSKGSAHLLNDKDNLSSKPSNSCTTEENTLSRMNELEEESNGNTFLFRNTNFCSNLKKDRLFNNLLSHISRNSDETSDEDTDCGKDSFFSSSDVDDSTTLKQDELSSIKSDHLKNITVKRKRPFGGDKQDEGREYDPSGDSAMEEGGVQNGGPSYEHSEVETQNEQMLERQERNPGVSRNMQEEQKERMEGKEKTGEITQIHDSNFLQRNEDVPWVESQRKSECSFWETEKGGGKIEECDNNTKNNSALPKGRNEPIEEGKELMPCNEEDELFLHDVDMSNHMCTSNLGNHSVTSNVGTFTTSNDKQIEGEENESVNFASLKKSLNSICSNKKSVNEFLALLRNDCLVKNKKFHKMIQNFLNKIKPVVGYYDNMLDSLNNETSYEVSKNEPMMNNTFCAKKIDKEFVKLIKKIIEYDKRRKNKSIKKLNNLSESSQIYKMNEFFIYSPNESYNTVKDFAQKILNYVPYVDDKKKINIKKVRKRFQCKNLVSQILLADYILDKLKNFPVNNSYQPTLNGKAVDSLLSETRLKAYTKFINDNLQEYQDVVKMEKCFAETYEGKKEEKFLFNREGLLNGRSGTNVKVKRENDHVSDDANDNESGPPMNKQMQERTDPMADPLPEHNAWFLNKNGKVFHDGGNEKDSNGAGVAGAIPVPIKMEDTSNAFNFNNYDDNHNALLRSGVYDDANVTPKGVRKAELDRDNRHSIIHIKGSMDNANVDSPLDGQVRINEPGRENDYIRTNQQMCQNASDHAVNPAVFNEMPLYQKVKEDELKNEAAKSIAPPSETGIYGDPNCGNVSNNGTNNGKRNRKSGGKSSAKSSGKGSGKGGGRGSTKGCNKENVKENGKIVASDNLPTLNETNAIKDAAKTKKPPMSHTNPFSGPPSESSNLDQQIQNLTKNEFFLSNRQKSLPIKNIAQTNKITKYKTSISVSNFSRELFKNNSILNYLPNGNNYLANNAPEKMPMKNGLPVSNLPAGEQDEEYAAPLEGDATVDSKNRQPDEQVPSMHSSAMNDMMVPLHVSNGQHVLSHDTTNFSNKKQKLVNTKYDSTPSKNATLENLNKCFINQAGTPFNAVQDYYMLNQSPAKWNKGLPNTEGIKSNASSFSYQQMQNWGDPQFVNKGDTSPLISTNLQMPVASAGSAHSSSRNSSAKKNSSKGSRIPKNSSSNSALVHSAGSSGVSGVSGVGGLSNGFSNNGLINNTLSNKGLSNNGLSNNGLINNTLSNNGLINNTLSSGGKPLFSRPNGEEEKFPSPMHAASQSGKYIPPNGRNMQMGQISQLSSTSQISPISQMAHSKPAMYDPPEVCPKNVRTNNLPNSNSSSHQIEVTSSGSCKKMQQIPMNNSSLNSEKKIYSMYKENQARGGVIGSSVVPGPSPSSSISRINDDALPFISATPSNYSVGYGTNQPVMQEADAKSKFLHEQMRNNQDMLSSDQKIFLDVSNKGNTIANYNYPTMARYPSNSIQNVNPLSTDNRRSNLGTNYSHANFLVNINNNKLESNEPLNFSNDSFNKNMSCSNLSSVKSDGNDEKRNLSSGALKTGADGNSHMFQRILQAKHQSDMQGAIPENHKTQPSYVNSSSGGGGAIINVLSSNIGNGVSSGIGSCVGNNISSGSAGYVDAGALSALKQPHMHMNDPQNNYIFSVNERGQKSLATMSPQGSNSQGFNQPNQLSQPNQPSHSTHPNQPSQQNINLNNMNGQAVKYHSANLPSRKQGGSVNYYVNQMNFILQVLNQLNSKGSTSPNGTQQGAGKPAMEHPAANQPSGSQSGMTHPGMNQPSMTQPSMTQPSMTQPSMTQPSMTQPSMTQPSMTQSSMTQGNLTAPIFGHSSSSVASSDGNKSLNISPFHSPNIKGKGFKQPFGDSSVNSPNITNMGTKGNLPKNMIQKIPPKNMYPSQDLIQQKLLQQQQELLQQKLQQQKMQKELFQKAYSEKENQSSTPQGAFQEMHNQCPPDNLMQNDQVRQQKLLQKIQQEQIQKQLQQLHSQQQFQVHQMQQKVHSQQMSSQKGPSPLKAQQLKQHLHAQKMNPQQMSPQQMNSQQINSQQMSPQKMNPQHITAQQLHAQQLKQIQMQKLQYQQQELKKHMEQLQQRIPLSQQKLHQLYNMKQNMFLSEDNEKKNKQSQISLPLNSHVPNMHNLQQLNKGEELLSKENLNSSMGGRVSGSVSGSMSASMSNGVGGVGGMAGSNIGGSNMGKNLGENAMYMINRKMSNNLNKLNNAEHFFSYDSFQQSLPPSKIDVKDMRTHDGKNINENSMLLNPAQARDLCNNNMPSRVVPNSMPPYISSNSPFKMNHHNKNNMNNNQQK